MQTDYSLAWLFLVFAGVGAYTGGGALGSSVLIWGSALFIQAPLALLNALTVTFPLAVPLGLLALVYYFQVLLPGVMGEGMTLFVVAAFLIVVLI